MQQHNNLSFFHRWTYPSLIAITQIIMAVIVVFIICKTFQSHHNRYPMFWSWDTGWYMHIVRNGYLIQDPTKAIQATAFYPLYPLLIRFVHFVTQLPYRVVTVGISNLAFYFAIIYLYRFVCKEYDIQIAQRTLWLLVAFPAAMFFHCAYTESLNLLFMVLFFYALQQDHWYRAMLAGMLAAITHGFGLLLILPAMVYLWNKRTVWDVKTQWLRLISLLIIPSGVFAYMIFLYIKTGSPFSFIYAHKFWHHKTTLPVWNAIHFLYILYHVPQQDWPFRVYSPIWNFKFTETINAVLSLIMVGMGVLMWTIYRNKISLSMKLFYIVAVLLSISSGSGGRLDSFGRYVLVLFPGFIIWAYSCREKTYLFLASFCVMLPFNTLLLGMFATGLWIT